MSRVTVELSHDGLSPVTFSGLQATLQLVDRGRKPAPADDVLPVPWAWFAAEDSTSPVDPMVDRVGGAGNLPLLSGSAATIVSGPGGQDVFDFSATGSYEALSASPSGGDGITLSVVVEGLTGSDSIGLYCSSASGNDAFGFLMDGEMSGEVSTLLVASPVLDGSAVFAVWRFGPSGARFLLDNVEVGSDATAQVTSDIAAFRIEVIGTARKFETKVFDRELTDAELSALWAGAQQEWGL